MMWKIYTVLVFPSRPGQLDRLGKDADQSKCSRSPFPMLLGQGSVLLLDNLAARRVGRVTLPQSIYQWRSFSDISCSQVTGTMYQEHKSANLSRWSAPLTKTSCCYRSATKHGPVNSRGRSRRRKASLPELNSFVMNFVHHSKRLQADRSGGKRLGQSVKSVIRYVRVLYELVRADPHSISTPCRISAVPNSQLEY